MVNEEKTQAIKELFKEEDIQRMWAKMHTPWIRTDRKVGRNEICPFCESGKKYKDCDCYKTKDTAKFKLDNKHTKGWR